MEFNDVFSIKFKRGVVKDKIRVTRMLKTLGYKNINLIVNENQDDSPVQTSVNFYPNNISSYFCKNNCIYSFFVKIFKYTKFSI